MSASMEHLCRPRLPAYLNDFAIPLNRPSGSGSSICTLRSFGRGVDAWDCKRPMQRISHRTCCALLPTLPAFRYQQHASFRGWLRTVTLNKWRERTRRVRLPIEEHGDWAIHDHATTDDPIIEFWDNEYRERITARAVELMRNEFQETTWLAFWGVVVHARPGTEVATELGITLGAVYAAKSRVLRRLRQELSGMVD